MSNELVVEPTNGPSTERARLELERRWRAHRRRLVDIGYRMLGSVADAEDVAGEAFARLAAADLIDIDDVEGWLVTVTGRLCLDRLRSAERRRRAYIGPWLPEPVLGSADPTAIDPADRVTLDDSVRMALLVVLEQLSPAERTAYVLHDLFAVPFEDIGEMVGRTPGACRQLASRARRRIQADAVTPRATVSSGELEQVVRRFADACEAGSIEGLLDVLDPEAVGDFDSGGLVQGAPVRSLTGAVGIAKLLVHVLGRPGVRCTAEAVNGEPGVVVRLHGEIVSVGAVDVRDGLIVAVHAVGNPLKLRHLA